jgi:hypothetical protein
MGKRFILWGIVITVLAVCLTGCGAEEKKGDEKLKDIEFTVLGEENIPEELKQIIDEKKEKEFKITYQDGDFLYICVGYGKQETGGYSITINELYLTANAIYMDTNLIGPEPENRELYHTQEKDGASYPYVVVKMEYLDKSVVFD